MTAKLCKVNGVAEIFGVDLDRAYRFTRERNFPSPVMRVGCTALWLRDDVRCHYYFRTMNSKRKKKR